MFHSGCVVTWKPRDPLAGPQADNTSTNAFLEGFCKRQAAWGLAGVPELASPSVSSPLPPPSLLPPSSTFDYKKIGKNV